MNALKVLFCHPLRSASSWLIMYVTGGLWSHVVLLTGEGTIFEAEIEES